MQMLEDGCFNSSFAPEAFQDHQLSQVKVTACSAIAPANSVVLPSHCSKLASPPGVIR